MAIFSYYLGKLPPVEHASWLLWDGVEALVQTPVREADLNEKIRVITIDRETYFNEYRGRSPLDAGKFADLIAKILTKNPRRLFVDVETDDLSFRGLIDRLAKKVGRPPEEIRKIVVWVDAGNGRLGNEFVEADQWAESKLTPDADQRTREVALCADRRPTLIALAAAEIGKVAPKECGADADIQDNHLFHPRPKFHAYWQAISRFSISTREVDSAELEDRTVFLGGTYARDVFFMGDGHEHSGVEILAVASLAVADGQVSSRFEEWQEMVLENGLGLMLPFFALWMSPKKAYFWGIFAVPVACLGIVAWITDFGRILSLGGILLGRLVEAGLDAADEAEKLHQKGG